MDGVGLIFLSFLAELGKMSLYRRSKSNKHDWFPPVLIPISWFAALFVWKHAGSQEVKEHFSVLLFHFVFVQMFSSLYYTSIESVEFNYFDKDFLVLSYKAGTVVRKWGLATTVSLYQPMYPNSPLHCKIVTFKHPNQDVCILQNMPCRLVIKKQKQLACPSHINQSEKQFPESLAAILIKGHLSYVLGL